MVTFAPVAPSAIVTVAGTEATPLLLLLRFTTWPPWPAGADSVTVSVPGEVVRFSGFGVSVIAAAEDAVIVTVAGVLFVKPSFTISCTTYVPATSATKLADTLFAFVSVALLPAGRLVNDQEYVSGSLSASDEPLPFTVTVAPI